MSLCYDFQKWTIISLASVAISLTIGLVLMQYAHGITEEERKANREKYAKMIEEDIKKQGPVFKENLTLQIPDFYMEGNVTAPAPDDPWYSVPKLIITKLGFQGDGSREMCPSLQCKIDYSNKFNNFIAPDTPERRLISATFDFRLQDDIAHADLGPKKKELVEQYHANLICDVVDIVEKNGQELYYCGPTFFPSNINNEFGSRSIFYRYLDITGTYDAKNGILKLSGNFTGNDIK